MNCFEVQEHWGNLANAISELIKKVEAETGSQSFRDISDRHSLSKIDKKLYEALEVATKAYEALEPKD